MSRRKKGPLHRDDLPQATEPVDVVDSIPDRSSKPAPWKCLLLLAIFLAWVSLLIFLGLAASP